MINRYRMLICMWPTVFLSFLTAQAAPLSSNAVWTWIKGDNHINQSGIYGMQGVANPANMPGARREAVTWTGADGTFWLFGGWGITDTGTGYLNDLWQFDPATTNWTWIRGDSTINQFAIYGTQGTEGSFNIPGARAGAVSWTDASGALWLFGGYGYPAAGDTGCLNDLWRFNPNTWNWTWIWGATTTNHHGTYGVRGQPNEANTPGARIGAAAWTDASGALWLFGGWGFDCFQDEGALNDLWKFNPAIDRWIWMKGSTRTNQNGIYSMSDAENTPGARAGAALWADDSGALWLFGGWGYPAAGGAGQLNDFWLFMPVTTNWHWINRVSSVNQHGAYGTQGVPDTSNTPGARQLAVRQKDAYDSVWLFGGWGYAAAGGAGQLNDLWKIDRATLAWTWINGANVTDQSGTYGVHGVPDPANMPGARSYSVSWMDRSGALWIFGGEAYDASGSLGLIGDLWKYDNFSGGHNSPAVAITNLAAVSTAAVDSVICSLSGTANSYAIGLMRWDNSLTGSGGSFPATAQWSIPNIALREGANVFTVSASNTLGEIATATATLIVPWSVPLAADYDGDGRADPAACIGSNLYVWLSSFNYNPRIGPAPLGLTGATPLAADFDDDGLADPAAYLGTDWHVWLSRSGYAHQGPYSFGTAGATPLSADFDGDGLADPAIYSAGQWTVWLSSAGYTPNGPHAFGIAGALPLAADFDGDGKADPMMYEDIGEWTIWTSSSGYTENGLFTLGYPGATPLAADFDGDGQADPTLSHNRQWYIWLSSLGYNRLGPFEFHLR